MYNTNFVNDNDSMYDLVFLYLLFNKTLHTLIVF